LCRPPGPVDRVEAVPAHDEVVAPSTLEVVRSGPATTGEPVPAGSALELVEQAAVPAEAIVARGSYQRIRALAPDQVVVAPVPADDVALAAAVDAVVATERHDHVLLVRAADAIVVQG
jgi:hypothetical protein